jgi:hypothetical protein
MITSTVPSYLSEILGGEVIPSSKLGYFRARLSNRLHEIVVSLFMKLELEGKITKAALARRIGRKPEQITRWLGAPGNWTSDTASDLLLGMGAELAMEAVPLSADQHDFGFSTTDDNDVLDTFFGDAGFTIGEQGEMETQTTLSALPVTPKPITAATTSSQQSPYAVFSNGVLWRDMLSQGSTHGARVVVFCDAHSQQKPQSERWNTLLSRVPYSPTVTDDEAELLYGMPIPVYALGGINAEGALE